MDPKSFDYDSLPAGYYDLIYRREKGSRSKWHHLKFSHVAAQARGTGKLLDIGCGPGTFIGALPAEQEAVGVDIAGPQIRYAQATYGTAAHAFRSIPARTSLPFTDKSFDTVTLIEIIEHLPLSDTHSLLSEAHRVLKPGGRLLMTTPNYQSLWPLLEFFVNTFSSVGYAKQHIEHFHPGRLAGLLGEHGFADIRVDPFLCFAPFWASVNWSLADKVFKFEHRWIDSKLGALLFACCRKDPHEH